MLSLILTLSMLNAKPSAQTAQVQTCQWPHTCATQSAAAAIVPEILPVVAGPIEICSWPHKCAETAQVQTCQWPHTCSNNS